MVVVVMVMVMEVMVVMVVDFIVIEEMGQGGGLGERDLSTMV